MRYLMAVVELALVTYVVVASAALLTETVVGTEHLVMIIGFLKLASWWQWLHTPSGFGLGVFGPAAFYTLWQIRQCRLAVNAV